MHEGSDHGPGYKYEKKRGYAHRAALEDKLGRKIKPGFLALHHCDNRACVECEHLYEGTHLDNWQDNSERNHGNRGTNNGNCTIDTETVKDIQSRPKASRAHARYLNMGWATYNRIHKKIRRAKG